LLHIRGSGSWMQSKCNKKTTTSSCHRLSSDKLLPLPYVFVVRTMQVVQFSSVFVVFAGA
jgi:hypothetical protein